jgi:F-type H+-transporting ATPase subunit delta
MSELRVASRYAKSLFDLAIEKGALGNVEEDSRTFIEVCDQNRGFENMLKSPIITSDKKWSIMTKLFGGKFSPITMSFIKIVLRKNRDIVLKKIFEAFEEMYNEKKGILTATVYTAVPVSEKIKKDITSFLEKETSRSINLKTGIREDILGGFVLQYEDKLLDASVASQLKSLRNHLINNN